MKRILLAIIALVVLGIACNYLYRSSRTTVVKNEIADKEENKEAKPITITTEEIQEENYTGTKPVIAGDGKLAQAAQAYVDATLQEFASQANEDVPSMRKEFGSDSPTANYTIDMQASLVESESTESVVLSTYVYTGGAHGSSSYKVMTASKQSGEILVLGDVIKDDMRDSFTALVKRKLLAWRPAGESDAPVVFEEDVANLKFESFANWALDGNALILYFGQYEVGPGVLGAFPFPLPNKEIASMLK